MEKDNQELLNPSIDTSNQNFGSFGNRLKQARINKNLSIDDVAAELFILPRHLEAIESENFKELPQLAFARGFVINYAKFLDLDSVQIAESFNRSYPDELRKKSVDDVESPLKPMGTVQREGKRSFRVNPLLILAVIGLIILAVFLIRTVSNAQNDTEVEEGTTTVTDDLTATEQSAGAAVSNTANPTNNGSALDLNNTGSALDLNSPDSETDANPSNSEDSTLDFWVTDNTPIQVIDATGKTLISGSPSRGAYKLKGKPPCKLQVENVSRVSLNLNGESIRLREFAENNKADFSLAP